MSQSPPYPAPPIRPSPLGTDSDGPGPMGYLALVFAWAIPGVGHLMIGQKTRGFIFGITIHGLFAAGLLIGGIRAINPPDQPIWTYTQLLTGWPMQIANRVEINTRDALAHMYDNSNTEYFRGREDPKMDPDKPNVPDNPSSDSRRAWAAAYFAAHPIFTNHPKPQDIGAVYCGIAGMLNLLVMFDVLLRVTNSVREETRRPNRGSFVGQFILQTADAMAPPKSPAGPTPPEPSSTGGPP